jgi:alkanesulfonate monooxygenase SsuD/methylene tetrahydromethanopterin reductase-like flavin-dependent oxidoreductase (luciferase family)
MTHGARIGYSLGPLLNTDELLQCAKLADTSENVDSIWVPESWGRESFATLGAISQVTSKVRLGTSIVSIFSRTPATVAMAATTLDSLSISRAVIGLGASTDAIVENWHGVKFERPLERMREFVQIVQAMISGERVTIKGRFFDVRNFKLLHAPVRRKIPVLIGAVNKGMISLAADLADGAILYLRPLDVLKETAEYFERTVSGREFEIACSIICAVSDADPDKARQRAAQTLSFYVAVGKYYREFLSRNGFEAESAAIHHAYSEGGQDAATRQVTDRMLEALAVCGTKDDCRRGLARFRSAGVTLPIIQFNPVGGTESSFRELLSTF